MSVDRSEASARERLQRAVGESFEVRGLLGRGGFADVFEAFDPRLKRRVALKVLKPEVSGDADLQHRFRREAESIAALRHPNILPIHAIGERDGVVYLVLERIDGESLEAYLQRPGIVTLEESRRILRECAAALDVAHAAGIVHRDLKPANIMLEGAERRVLLMDFGIARALERESDYTRGGLLIGTPHYMSPEQAAGDVADYRSDLYALGVLGYRLVTGRLPFDGPTASVLVKQITRAPDPIRSLRRECPAGLAAAIERCLQKAPEERWQSARDLIDAIESRAQTDSTEAGGRSEHSRTAAQWFQVPILGAAILLAAVVIDALVLRSFVVTPLAAMVAAAMIARGYSRHWMAGPRRAVAEEDEEFGRYGGAVRQAQLDRTNIVRALSELSHVEQKRSERCRPATDHLLARVVQHVRKLRALDERIGVERARRGKGRRFGGEETPVPAGPAPRRLMDELQSARLQAVAELDRVLGVLARLREVASTADRADGASFERELAAMLSAAQESGATSS